MAKAADEIGLYARSAKERPIYSRIVESGHGAAVQAKRASRDDQISTL
jgi:hypothetical protein